MRSKIKAGLIGAIVGLSVFPILKVSQLVEEKVVNELGSTLLSAIIFAIGFGLVIGLGYFVNAILNGNASDNLGRSLVIGFLGGLIGIVIGREFGGVFDGPFGGLLGGLILVIVLSQSKNPLGWVFSIAAIYSGYRGYWLVMMVAGILAFVLFLGTKQSKDDEDNNKALDDHSSS